MIFATIKRFLIYYIARNICMKNRNKGSETHQYQFFHSVYIHIKTTFLLKKVILSTIKNAYIVYKFSILNTLSNSSKFRISILPPISVPFNLFIITSFSSIAGKYIEFNLKQYSIH